MYIFPNLPQARQEAQWISRSLRIGDCFDVLLHNKTELCDPVYRTLEGYGILLPEATYVLVQFHSGDLWTADRLLEGEPISLLNQIFAIFGGMFPLHLFTAQGCLYGLLVFENGFSGEQFNWKVTNCCQRLLSQRQDLPLQILISKDEFGVQGIFHAANSLRYGFDYLRFFDETPQYLFLNLQQQTALGSKDESETYQRLAATLAEQLRDENFDPESTAREVVNMLRENSSCSIESLHSQMHSFSLIFLNRLMEETVVDRGFLMQQKISRRIMDGDRCALYLRNLTETLDMIHRRHQELSARYNISYLNRVRSYVKANISSMDLSVSQIAEHFGTNRSQLTAQFRDYYGKSLAEFIHSTRLDRALLLMESHPGRPVGQIAAEAGYCSLSTMYRAFQKNGLEAPAQHRKTMGGK